MIVTPPRRAVRFRTAGIYAVIELDDGSEIDLAGVQLDLRNEHDNLLTWLAGQLRAHERYDAARILDPNIVEPDSCDCQCDACRECRDKP